MATCLAKRLQTAIFAPLTLLLLMSLSLPNAYAASEKTQQANRLPLEDVQRFSSAISQIKSYYVKSVEDKDLFESAIRGMLSGLDPHSSYLDEEEFKELTSSTRGNFGGLGIEVTMEKGVLKVISPIDDTPAAKAGLQSGDYIVRIDNKPLQDMSLREAVTLMRGKAGTKIKLTIIRKGEKKPLTFNIVRAVIKINTVKSKLLDSNYAYVRVSHFQSPTVQDMLNNIKKLQTASKGKISGLILDLRNNPGGLLDSAVKMSDAFIHNDQKGEEEMIVYTKGRLPGSELKAYASPGDILKNAPMVVLINGGSASGSEIVAGALKDNKRAIIMGTRSFGKGSVQTVIPLDQKRGIKLTTALYFTPSGRSIQAKGIEPDIIIKQIKVDKAKNKKDQFTMLKESDLSGHLANGNGDVKPITKKKSLKVDSSDLVYSDYQLYEALNLLKGLSVTQKSATSK